MNEKRLGKIQAASFGYGGYQEAQFGVSWTLGGEGWGVCDFWGHWGTKRSEFCKWTEADRINGLGDTCMRLKAVLDDAKKPSVDKLIGVPIEMTFDGNLLKEWRVLKEVI